MLDIEKVKEKALERGYELHSRTSDYSRYNFINNLGIGLLVYPKSDEFEIYYNVDLCTSLQGGRCGSFFNDKHFNNHESRIKKYVEVLKLHFGS